ncbi:MAG: hypothetical protein JSU67_18525 [Gammaproteobacteria bacterium]|nr:MAG: hypothetical protein JSU67_18525 [Gammaproteobacteria bacterium]
MTMPLLIIINDIGGPDHRLETSKKGPEFTMKKQLLALMGIFTLLVAIMASTAPAFS